MKKWFSGEAFSVMHVRNFRYFLFYRIFMTMATLMQSVIVSWQMYDLTKNVLWLGFIGLVEVIPQISVSLFSGHYIDLWDRRKIINYTTLLLILGSGVLTVYSIPELNSYEKFGVYPIFFAVFLTGLSRGILMPAHTAFLGQLIPRNLYANAATWSSANWQVAAVLGPALGGLIYGFWGIIPAYNLVFTFYLIAFFMIMAIKSGRHEVVVTDESIWTRIQAGFKFVFKTPELLGAFALDMFAVLFGGAVALLPAFAADVLHVGPQGLGFLRACPAIGATLMAIFLMFRPPVKRTGKILFVSVIGFGLCMIGFALSTSFILSGLLLLLSGAFDNVSVVIRGTILQLFTPDNMRGRVASVNSIFIGSSNELGAFESGVAARFMGLVPSVIFGGFMTLVVVAVTYKSNSFLRKLSLKNRM